jgi:hypothetical protein
MLRACSIASGSYPSANVDRTANTPTRTDAARRYRSIQGAISTVLLRLIARDVGLAPGGSPYEAVVMRVVEDSGSRDRDTLRTLRA